jgi:3,4-dihydroxy 2-butanone 4-phosphate synthase / GTP cyclohydrolase II
MSLTKSSEPSPQWLSRVNAAVADIRAGRMIILVDDEDRENEGDLTMAAQFANRETINFMATHGRGLICVTLTEEQVTRLKLPMMESPGRAGPPLGTAFTVSVEARKGVTTGISAEDRAHTTRVAASPDSHAEDLVTPGHVFPLRSRRGGVLVRTGQTEGSVDLARLAGLTPAGVICEIMKDDGEMARLPDLEIFAEKHGLKILSVADLIQYRLQTEKLVQRISERKITLDVTGTEWTAIVYDVPVDGTQFLALVKGTLMGETPALCRMHKGSLVADVFASTPRDGGKRLAEALMRIEREGRGVLVYLPEQGSAFASLTKEREPAKGDATKEEHDNPLREFGLGAQVLRDLGVERLRLLSNSPRKILGLRGFGLEVTETLPLGNDSA